jgi:predicted DNA-binding protein with PD1-like motif
MWWSRGVGCVDDLTLRCTKNHDDEKRKKQKLKKIEILLLLG